MDNLGIASVAAITVVCYLIGMAVRASAIDSKWIPIICGALGAVLGVAAFFVGMPEFPAGDPITALAVGIVSGLAATGVNQAIGQLTGDKE